MKSVRKNAKKSKNNRFKGFKENDRKLIGVQRNAGEFPLFWYSVPVLTGLEPTLLTSYPGNTAKYLLNYLGDDFKNGKLSLPPVGTDVEVKGYLGENGDLPVRLRRLRTGLAELAYEELCCQSWSILPVVVVTLPDPHGYWPEDIRCDRRVAFAAEWLDVAFGDDTNKQDEFLERVGALQKDSKPLRNP
jgi:hypothetical protein